MRLPRRLVPRALPLAALAALAAAAAGCASPLSTFHTGRTLPRNRVALTTGLGLNVASTFVSAAVDNAELAADKVRQAATQGQVAPLSEAETRDLVRGAYSYALFSPLPLWELGLRYGILDRWEAGAAYTTSGFRFETKVQLVKREVLDLALGLQVLHQVLEIPLPSFLKDVLEIEDLSRTDLTVPLLASRHFGPYGFVYGGAKFVYSFLQADVLERVTDLTGRKTDAGGGMWLLGGLVGGGAGYKYVFVMLELNVLYYDYRPQLLGTKVNLSGVDVYPALGLRINFFGS